jgi:WD40 repeat protein
MIAASSSSSSSSLPQSPPRYESPVPKESVRDDDDDSPISRFRRENNHDDDDDDDDTGVEEKKQDVGQQLQREIREARRRAAMCSTVSVVGGGDERIQSLVTKALQSPHYHAASSASSSGWSARTRSAPHLVPEQHARNRSGSFVRHGPNDDTNVAALLDTEDGTVANTTCSNGDNNATSIDTIEDQDDLQATDDNNNNDNSDIEQRSDEVDAVLAERLPYDFTPKADSNNNKNDDNNDTTPSPCNDDSSSSLNKNESCTSLTQRPSPDSDVVRKAHFIPGTNYNTTQLTIERCASGGTELSMTESDVNSMDGLPLQLQSHFTSRPRENMLQSLDGIPRKKNNNNNNNNNGGSFVVSETTSRQQSKSQSQSSPSFFDSWFSGFLFGTTNDNISEGSTCEHDDDDVNDHHNSTSTKRGSNNRWNVPDDSFALLGCSNLIHNHERVPAVPTSLIRVTRQPYAHQHAVDPRMQSWVKNQLTLVRERPCADGTYQLGTSRTVVVHEIARGNWTWCTAWSPNGELLAVATENHHLAVVDTTQSVVWRVKHDRKISGPVKNGTTHSIRSIAWGKDFIAIGGTGNAVSILASTEPYSIKAVISDTGFVGSLHWKPDSNELAVASRIGKAMVLRIRGSENKIDSPRIVHSQVLCEIKRNHWVHTIKFSPSGKYLAIGDAGGFLLVYNYLDEPPRHVELSLIKSFKLDDAVLAVEWSADGRWLYAGGEDFRITVVETRYWEIVHQVKRDRWVQCISSSKSGSHVAVGGVSSEISLLDVNNGWDSCMGIELNGLVPLSASWHPMDQFLSLTGQNNSILVVETTNARHVKGHHLHSVAPILSIEFSPDGRMAIVGNSNGVVTFFTLSRSTFEVSYELMVVLNDRLSIHWSLNGVFVAIGSQNALIIVGRTAESVQSQKTPPKASGFSVRKVMNNFSNINAVSIDFQSQYVAVSGNGGTWILDAANDFKMVREWLSGPVYANAWAPDGRWIATIGADKILTVYDTSETRVDRWRAMFSVACDDIGRALSWGTMIVGGLLYLAYGGDGKKITIMEIRTQEGTWETVLRIPRAAGINALDWNMDGLLAAAIGNGTVGIIDLAYLQIGVPVNEMDYTWQRQALTCFTEVRRNRGKNSMQTVRWIPSAPGSDSLLALGGRDGELEIVDLTQRDRCRGYVQP